LADKRSVHIARRRKGKVAWAAGATEISLHPSSAVDDQKTESIVVLARIGLGPRFKKQSLIATAAMPVRLDKLAQWGLGEPRVQRVFVESGVVMVNAEYVYAGKVVATEEIVPSGQLARKAFEQLILAGRLFRGVVEQSRELIQEKLLFDELCLRGLAEGTPEGTSLAGPSLKSGDADPLQVWVAARLATLGVADGTDLGLLSESDFIFDRLNAEQSQWIKRNFPTRVNLGDVQYQTEYDFGRKTVTLVKVAGKRNEPPSKTMLPGFVGFKVKIKHHSRVWML